jgi:hypothetical protein
MTGAAGSPMKRMRARQTRVTVVFIADETSIRGWRRKKENGVARSAQSEGQGGVLNTKETKITKKEGREEDLIEIVFSIH